MLGKPRTEVGRVSKRLSGSCGVKERLGSRKGSQGACVEEGRRRAEVKVVFGAATDMGRR